MELDAGIGRDSFSKNHTINAALPASHLFEALVQILFVPASLGSFLRETAFLFQWTADKGAQQCSSRPPPHPALRATFPPAGGRLFSPFHKGAVGAHIVRPPVWNPPPPSGAPLSQGGHNPPPPVGRHPLSKGGKWRTCPWGATTRRARRREPNRQAVLVSGCGEFSPAGPDTPPGSAVRRPAGSPAVSAVP